MLAIAPRRPVSSSLLIRAPALALVVALGCSGDDSGETEGSSGTTSGGTTSGGTTGTPPRGGTPRGATIRGGPGESTTVESTTSESTTGESTGASGPPFAEVHAILMKSGCTSGYCHGAAAGGLALTDAKASYASLVGVAATAAGCGADVRVVPGDPEASVLWLRVRPSSLDGGAPCGPKMPQGSMGLGEAEAAVVEAWIAGGAAE